MKIGIDMDEVIAEFLLSFLDFHNEQYGTNLTKDQFESYHLWHAWGGTKEDAIEKVHAFHKTHHFKNIVPVDDAKRVILLLKEKHDLFVITSRQDAVAEETKVWIQAHFPQTFSDVHFTNHFSKNGSEKRKGDICDRIDIDVMIEDSLDYAKECVRPNRRVFLLDRPWNRSQELSEGIIRVHSWNEILNQL